MNDAIETCQLLKSAACRAERDLNAALAPENVSYCQAVILLRLQDGKESMSALAELLCCNKSNVTQVVQGLLKKKLVMTSSDEKDRRLTTVALTAEGKAAARSIGSVLSDSAKECLCDLSDADQKALRSLLCKCAVESAHD